MNSHRSFLLNNMEHDVAPDDVLSIALNALFRYGYDSDLINHDMKKKIEKDFLFNLIMRYYDEFVSYKNLRKLCRILLSKNMHYDVNLAKLFVVLLQVGDKPLLITFAKRFKDFRIILHKCKVYNFDIFNTSKFDELLNDCLTIYNFYEVRLNNTVYLCTLMPFRGTHLYVCGFHKKLYVFAKDNLADAFRKFSVFSKCVDSDFTERLNLNVIFNLSETFSKEHKFHQIMIDLNFTEMLILSGLWWLYLRNNTNAFCIYSENLRRVLNLSLTKYLFSFLKRS